jgi:dephospho-CoA kinase
MIKVGITGGIGSGKTTVCKIFEKYKIPVYYADDRAKKLMTANKEVKSAIINIFGKDVYFLNGRLNRKKLASMVFNDKELLNQLNSIVHPAVAQDGEEWFASLGKKKFALKEAALLIESGSYKKLDKLIVVTCPQDIRIQRVMIRDKVSKEAVLSRIKNQLAESKKVKLADFIINNDGEHDLESQVKHIIRELNSK